MTFDHNNTRRKPRKLVRKKMTARKVRRLDETSCEKQGDPRGILPPTRVIQPNSAGLFKSPPSGHSSYKTAPSSPQRDSFVNHFSKQSRGSRRTGDRSRGLNTDSQESLSPLPTTYSSKDSKYGDPKLHKIGRPEVTISYSGRSSSVPMYMYKLPDAARFYQ